MDDLLVEQPPDEHIAKPRVGELLEPPGAGTVFRVGGEQRVARVCLVEIGADHRRIAAREIALDQHRDAAERAEAAEFFIAVERRDRVDLEGQSYDVHARQHLADIGADVAADDRERLSHRAAMALTTPRGKLALDTLQL